MSSTGTGVWTLGPGWSHCLGELWNFREVWVEGLHPWRQLWELTALLPFPFATALLPACVKRWSLSFLLQRPAALPPRPSLTFPLEPQTLSFIRSLQSQCFIVAWKTHISEYICHRNIKLTNTHMWKGVDSTRSHKSRMHSKKKYFPFRSWMKARTWEVRRSRGDL